MENDGSEIRWTNKEFKYEIIIKQFNFVLSKELFFMYYIVFFNRIHNT